MFIYVIEYDLKVVFLCQSAALLGGVNALHTAFPEDAEEEYVLQGEPLMLSDTHQLVLCGITLSILNCL